LQTKDDANRQVQVLPRFRYHKPAILEEAVGLLEDFGPNGRILAGGTDLLVGLGDGTISAAHVIDIKGITELSDISYADGTLTIGACVTVNRLLEFGGLPKACGALRAAAARLATHQIRNRATVVGNVCNASPACDMGPPLLVLDAYLRSASSRGERTIPLRDFFRGVKCTCCEPTEIVTGVVVPAGKDTVSVFSKRKRIRGHDLSLVNGAAACENGTGVRIALGAVAPTPVLIEGLERWGLSERHKMVRHAVASISPIDDVRSSSSYRLAMAERIVDDMLRFLSHSGAGEGNT
jgi:CO/xanthine dehydrogenase FAD-binding subunit